MHNHPISSTSASPDGSKWAEFHLSNEPRIYFPHDEYPIEQIEVISFSTFFKKLLIPSTINCSEGFVAQTSLAEKKVTVYCHPSCHSNLRKYGLDQDSITLKEGIYEINVVLDEGKFIEAYRNAYGDRRRIPRLPPSVDSGTELQKLSSKEL